MRRLLAAACACACACASAPAPAPAPAPVASAGNNPEREQRAHGDAPDAGPAAAQVTPDAPFRESAPPPTPPAEFHAPVPKQFKLRNGLPVFLIERREVPLVTVALSVRSGVDTEPQGRAGLASLALELLDEGTPTRDAPAIARGFEDLAARYSTQADADATGLQVTALVETLGPVLDLFSDVALHPVFRDADVERVRVEQLGQIAQALDDPPSVGQHVLSRVIFGDKHPWGFPAEGTVRSVKAVSRKDLIAWHRAHFRPDNAALFVVGNTDQAALAPLLEKTFGAWKAAKGPKPARHSVPRAGARTTIYLVDKPDAPQSQIWLGEVGVASTAPDIFPVRVMNHILGGSFNSRLNGNLRTEHAYSYGVFSFYDPHREAGPFMASGGVVSDKTAEALTEFMKELQRMKTGEVSQAELSDAKDGLIRAIPALFTRGDQTAGAYARAWSHGLPADDYATYQARVEAVTSADVAGGARAAASGSARHRRGGAGEIDRSETHRSGPRQDRAARRERRRAQGRGGGTSGEVMGGEPALQLWSVGKSYGAFRKREVLRGVSIRVERGECYGLAGPNSRAWPGEPQGNSLRKKEVDMGLIEREGNAPADVVRRQYIASAAGDLQALRATLAPDVEWTEMAGFPLAGTFRTPSDVTSSVMEALGRDWEDWAAHDDRYVADGENVVVLARYTAVAVRDAGLLPGSGGQRGRPQVRGFEERGQTPRPRYPAKQLDYQVEPRPPDAVYYTPEP